MIRKFVSAHKKLTLATVFFCFSFMSAFAASADKGQEWIDTSVLYMIDSFAGNTSYYILVALKLARLMMILMLLWNFIQMVIGTMEGRKVFIGSVTKWLFFLFALHVYPAFSYGLRQLAIEIGTGASGASISGLTNALGKYMEELEALAQAAVNEDYTALEEELKGAQSMFDLYKAEYDAAKTAYDAAVDGGIPTYRLTAQINGLKDLELKMKNSSKNVELRNAQLSAISENPMGETRTLQALRRVLIRNGNSITSKYKLNIGLMTADGRDTGLISPNAMFRVGVLAGQIMWEKEWEVIDNEIEENKNERSRFSPLKNSKLFNFPVSRIFDLALALVAIVALIIVLAACLIQYIMALIEYTITSSFAIVLIPCMLFDPFKDMAQKILPTLFAQAVKLVFITMAMFFACWSFLQLARNISESASGFDFNLFAYVIFTGLLAAVFCVFAPKWAQTLLTGQPQMSMGEFVAVGAAAAAGAMKGASVVGGAASAAKSGVQKGASGAVNAAGSIAAMGGAGSAAKQAAAAEGKGAMGQRLAAAKGALSEGASRFTGSLKESANNFVRGGGKGGAGGKGGSNKEINKHTPADKTTGDTNNTRDFARHSTDGRKSSIGEFLAAQRQSGMNNQRLRNDTNYKNMPKK